jgi:hypothetical protein
MFRILRAFAWLRWRILLNSLERGGGRDVVERFSVAIEQLAPTIVALVMAPSALALAGAGAYAGWSLARGELLPVIFPILRFLLLAGCVLAVLGPVILPAAERTNAVRLLLLPIPRGVLYLGQAMSTLADPWILLTAAVVLAVPAGFAAGGATSGAVLALAAGLFLLATLMGISLVVTTAVHLIARDRRRGELLMLVFILILPVVGMLPGLLDGERRQRSRANPTQRYQQGPPAWWDGFERTARLVIPSELYASGIRSSASGDATGAARPVLALAGSATLLHALAFVVFIRILSSPGSVGSSRSGGPSPLTARRLPGISQGTSAVAINQLRLALRTPRGRATILSPVVVFVMFAVLMFRSHSGGMEFGFIRLNSGIGLAAFGSFFALVSLLPLAMNQFAIDRAGLTLAMLAPLETHALLRGKAIGNALIAAMPAGLCLAGALVLFPAGDPALWLCVPLTLVATYLLVAPAAAALSAVFPRAVDLNSSGRGSNAHGFANLLGMLVFAASGAPCLVLVLIATELLERPLLAPIFLLGWTAVCGALSWILFNAVAALFERRRENLGMVA